VSNPYDDAAQAETKKIIEETVGSFSKAYVRAMAAVTCKNLSAEYLENEKKKRQENKEDAAEEEQPQALKVRRLKRDPNPPVQTDPHKEGEMIKQGAVRKNWKKRFFVVQPDYKIAYFESKEGKEINSVSLHGYYVQDFQDKKWTIHLQHWRRRNWYFECLSEEDFFSWKEMLRTMTWKGPSPLDQDPFNNTVFKRAYQAMYAEWYGYSYFSPDGSESDMLSEFVFRRVRWSVLWRVYSAIKGPAKMQSVVRDQIEKAVQSAIDSAAIAAWKGVVESREKLKGPMEEKIRSNGGPIFDAQAKMHENVKAKIMGVLTPAMDKTAKPIFEKAVGVFTGPVSEAYVEMMQQFKKLVAETAERYDKDYSKATHMNWYVWGKLYECRRLFNKMVGSAAFKALNSGEKSDSGEEAPSNDYLAYDLEDAFTQLMKDALYSLSLCLKPEQVYDDVLHDIKILFEEQTKNFLIALMFPAVWTALKAGGVTAQLQALDESIPGGMTDFISAEEIAENIVQEVCSDMVDNLAGAHIPPAIEAIQKGYNDHMLAPVESYN